MSGSGRSDASIQQFFLPTPGTSPVKKGATAPLTNVGDGFTEQEIHDALRPALLDWHPEQEYEDLDISLLQPGPHAVVFMGRVANIYDLANTPKSPRSAKGCVKLCVKDGGGAITVRLWYASRIPVLRLGSLVTIWTSHISNGEYGTLSSASAPLFVSLFPERDRNCHIMVHDYSDCNMLKRPLGYLEGVPLNNLMTLQNFIDGGYDVTNSRILVVVKSIGARKKVTRKEGGVTENLNVHVHDDTAEATIGLWGTLSSSPLATTHDFADSGVTPSPGESWKPGETVLLLQSPGWKFGHTNYLSFTSSTIVDVNPGIPDADWLRGWSLRHKNREAINPPFPEGIFDKNTVKSGPVRCLFTVAELDEFARCAPGETFQGYLSLLITEIRLLDLWRGNKLLSGECCHMPIYANADSAECRGCDKIVSLRLNPRILGQVIDETAAIACGKLLFSDEAWQNLLGRGVDDLLTLGYEEIKHLSDRLLFCRITVLFGWSSDESKAGGRICVLDVEA